MITIGLPVYNSMNIVWLALEGICNQIAFEKFELIIHEEKEKGCGEAYYRSYEKRLELVGCSLKYIQAKERTPLSVKWLEIAEHANPYSIGLCLQGSDDFAEPHRVQTSFEQLHDYDWSQNRFGLFYNIPDGKVMVQDFNTRFFKTGTNIAINMEVAKKLPYEEVWRGADHWLFDRCNPKKILTNESSNWKQGIFTQGLNTLSNRNFDNIVPPYLPTDLKPDLPDKIIQRLNDYRRIYS